MAGLFLSFSDIQQANESFSDKKMIVARAENRSTAGATFLSYSSLDEDYLPAIIVILESHGASVYVDKKDPTLPPTPSQETADKLRRNIGRSSKFVLFVTPNSKESKWIPWELGLADGVETKNKIALFPAAETRYEQKWAEQEYLGLYRRIVWGQIEDEEEGWMVLDHRKNEATYLRKWLRRY